MKQNRKIEIILITILIMTCSIVSGQISQGGIPYSFQKNLKKSDGSTIKLSEKIPIIKMPAVNESAITLIKEKNKSDDGIFQFAYGFDINLDVKESSIIEPLDLGFLYRLSIQSKEALSLNLIFSKYILPEGAKLFIYSKDKQNVIGSFTSDNNKKSERLPTIPVKGDELIIEYFEPYSSEFEGQIIIGKVSHDFLGVTYEDDDGSNNNGSGPCQVDVNCSPEGNNWKKEKQAVVKIIINGNGSCSGTLMNNTNLDGTPYVLTAFHCLDRNEDDILSSSDKNLSDYCFIFNFENTSCSSNDASSSQSISGADFIAAHFDTDFALIKLSHKPISTWNPYYAGWDRNNTQGVGGVGIHHPKGDIKKIATHSMSPANFGNNFWFINQWLLTPNGLSIPESGSSGSALFNSNGYVIGQLKGAPINQNDGCTIPFSNNNASVYGKISNSWNSSNNNSSEQLQNWLDPSNKGVTTLNGSNVCNKGSINYLNLNHTVNSGVVEIKKANNTIVSSSKIKTGATSRYEAGKNIFLKTTFRAEEGSKFLAKINPSENCVPGCNPIAFSIDNFIFSNGGNLCVSQENATSYYLELRTFGNNQLACQVAGSVTSSQLCIPISCNLGSGLFNVELRLYNACHQISHSYIAQLLGFKNKTTQDSNELKIDESTSSNLDFEIAPNPNNGDFSINIKTEEAITYSFEIINSMGLSVYRIDQLQESQINVSKSSLNSGIYYIRINNGKTIVSKKMIIL